MAGVCAVLLRLRVLAAQIRNSCYQLLIHLFSVQMLMRVSSGFFVGGWAKFMRHKQLLGMVIHSAHPLGPLLHSFIGGVSIVRVLLLE